MTIPLLAYLLPTRREPPAGWAPVEDQSAGLVAGADGRCRCRPPATAGARTEAAPARHRPSPGEALFDVPEAATRTRAAPASRRR